MLAEDMLLSLFCALNMCICYVLCTVHVIVVSWFYSVLGFLLCEGCMYFQGQSPRKYIQHEGGTIPCTVKTMRQAYRLTTR